MLIVSHLCRCTQPLRAVQSKLLLSGTRNSLNSALATRQLITPVRNANAGRLGYRGFRLSELVKSNGIVARLCSGAPKPPAKTPKVVGYWLLGCSGMVFTAVVLGMAAGYFILLYSVYHVVNMVLKTTNGSK